MIYLIATIISWCIFVYDTIICMLFHRNSHRAIVIHNEVYKWHCKKCERIWLKK